MSVFSLQKASPLVFSHMNKQAFQSLPLNILISLASFSFGSDLDELVVYVLVFCLSVRVCVLVFLDSECVLSER